MTESSDKEVSSEPVLAGNDEEIEQVRCGSPAHSAGSDMFDSENKVSSPETEQPATRIAARKILSHAALLKRRGSASSSAEAAPNMADLVFSEEESSHSSSSDDEALQNVLMAATGRDNRNRAARAASRNVQQGIGVEDPLNMPVPCPPSSNANVMQRVLSALEESEAQTKNLSSLKRRVAKIASSGKKALDAPLPDVIAGRVERAAAYKKSTKEISDKWAPVIAKNRRAKNLSFPLNESRRAVHLNTNSVITGFKPESNFEKEIQELLKEGGVTKETDVVKLEDEALKSSVTKEEVIKRRRELAKMRSLMFNYERKMKRISKIKSKKYRKILKNERTRIEQDIGELSDDIEGTAIGKLESEKRRAEERMTLRHKNTSKWVRRQLSRGETKRNPEARAAVEEQLRIHDELRRRQEGVVELSDSDNADGERDESDIPSEDEALDKELSKMRGELEGDAAVKLAKKSNSGLMGMKFMKVAAERQRKQALSLLDELDEDGAEDVDEYSIDTGEVAKSRNSSKCQPELIGRQMFLGNEEEKKDVKAKSDGSRNETQAIHDSEDEMEALEQHLRSAYEKDDCLPSDRSRNPEFDVRAAASEIRKPLSNESGFTTVLQGRFKVEKREHVPQQNAVESEILIDVMQGSTEAANGQISEAFDAARNTFDNESQTARGKYKRKKEPESDNELIPASEAGKKRLKAVKFEKCAIKPLGDVSITESGTGQNQATGWVDGVLSHDRNLSAEEEGKRLTKKSNECNQPRNKPKITVTVGEWNKKGDNSQAFTKGTTVSKHAKRKSAEKAGLSEDRSASNVVAAASAKTETMSEKERMEMVARAFAGIGGADEADFEASKEKDIQLDASAAATGRLVTDLPGWGTWDGEGVSKNYKGKKESAFSKAAKQHLEETRRKAIAKRADRNLPNVQLNTKRSKLLADLTLSSVPFPFRSASEWEREVSVPVVKEVVSGRSFRSRIERKVETKRGAIIEPIQTAEKSESIRKSKETVRGKRAVIDRRKKLSKDRSSMRRALLT